MSHRSNQYDLLRQRVDDAYVEMRRNLNQSLYADGPAAPKPRVTLRRRIHRAADRAHDAWLVLTGRAEIG